MLNRDLVRNLIATADKADSPEAAYQCTWMAFMHIAQDTAVRTGLHPTYTLRRNGTLETRNVDGYKMPDLIPIRTTLLLDRFAETIPMEDKLSLLRHDSVVYFCKHIPEHQGKRLGRSPHKQDIRGVLDVTFTLDGRYPVWSPLDARMIAKAISSQDSTEINKAVRAVISVLETVHRNLITCGHAESADTPEVLDHAATLLRFVIAAYDMDN